MENKKTQTENNGNKNDRIKVAASVVMIALTIALLAFLAANRCLDKIGRESPDDIISAEYESFDGDGRAGIDPNDVAWSRVDELDDGNLINILLIGQDSRPGQGRQRSDSMILCSINPKTEEIALVSFLRDLYVQLPGDYSDNRLNAPYAFGGFNLLRETLELNFGITVDGCFAVDFNGFADVIDTLGGVDIELSDEEADLIQRQTKAGMNHLNGEQALEYVRIRKIGTDFGRTERQRKVIVAVLSRLRGASLKELNAIADEILPCMSTDMSNTEIMGYIAKCRKALDGDIRTYHVPADGAYYGATIRGMAVLVPNLPLIRQQLENYLPLPQ